MQKTRLHNIIHPYGEYLNGLRMDEIQSIQGKIAYLAGKKSRPVVDLTYVTRIDSLGVGLLIKPLLKNFPAVICEHGKDVNCAVRDSLGDDVSRVFFYDNLGLYLNSGLDA